jgi:glutathione synthase/RimK-type ligase-like ATP-grasp enzyme
MLFILTNSQDATASFLTSALEKAGISFLRLDTDSLLPRIALSYQPGKPAIRVDGCWHTPDEVSHIWYRRPEQLKDARFDSSPESNYTRSEWTELIECFFAHVHAERWVNHPAHNAVASRKLEQLTTAVKLGLRIPDTLVTQEPDELRAFFRKHDGHLIVKPLSTGYIERTGEEKDTLIYTNRVLEKHLENLDDMAVCPTLFQQFILKRNDVRITMVGSDIHAVELLAVDKPGEQRCDIRRNNMSDVVYTPITLPADVSAALRKLVAHYGLRFGAIDMTVAKTGEWYFFEINPNGQWAWLDMTARTNIASSFVRMFSGGACNCI